MTYLTFVIVEKHEAYYQCFVCNVLTTSVHESYNTQAYAVSKMTLKLTHKTNDNIKIQHNTHISVNYT